MANVPIIKRISDVFSLNFIFLSSLFWWWVRLDPHPLVFGSAEQQHCEHGNDHARNGADGVNYIKNDFLHFSFSSLFFWFWEEV